MDYLDVLARIHLSDLHNYEIKFCSIYAILYVYNSIFIPCNLTTGTPRPQCSKSCYFLRNNCTRHYNLILEYDKILAEDSFIDDCDNTFNFINNAHNFSNSSKDFEDDCLDLPGMLFDIT